MTAPAPARAPTRAPARTRAPGSGRAPAARPAPSARRAPARTRRPAPTGTLGLLWFVVLLGATTAGPLAVAVVGAPVAAVAAASLLRQGGAPAGGRLLGAGGAALVPLAAAAGGWLAAVAALAVAGAAGALAGAPRRRRAAGAAAGAAGVSPWGRAGWVGAPALAAASLVLADHGSTGTSLCLAAAICLYDVANHLMGTGSTGGPLGALAGMLTVGVLAVLAAAVIDPPFSGSRPWVMFAVVAVLAPLGVVLGRRMARGSTLPALRRLDSLLLAGPAWVVATHLILR